jgi:hypothetical protein
MPLGVSTMQSLDDVDECIVRQYVCRAEQVLTGEMPRTQLLTSAKRTVANRVGGRLRR